MTAKQVIAALEHGLKQGLAALERALPLDQSGAREVAAALDAQADVLAPQQELATRAAWLLVEAGLASVPAFLVMLSEETYQEEGPSRTFDQALPDNRAMNARRALMARELLAGFEAPGWAPEPPPLLREDPRHQAAQVLRRARAEAPARYAALLERARANGPSWIVDGDGWVESFDRADAMLRLQSLLDQERWADVLERAPALIRRHDDPRLSWALARAHHKRHEPTHAIEVLEAGLAAHPDNLGLLGELVIVLILANQPARAVAEWRARRGGLDRNRPADELGLLLQNLLAAYAAIGQPGEGLAELEPELAATESQLPLFNCACVAALARDLPRVLAYTERLLAAGRAPADFENESDFAAIRDEPAFRELLARDFTGSRVILEALGQPGLEDVRQGLAWFRAWHVERGHGADLSLFTLEPDDGSGELQPNPLFDGIMARHGRELGRAALLDLVAGLYGPNGVYHEQRALRQALLILLEQRDRPLEDALSDIFLAGEANRDDGHRSYEHTALDCFLEEIFPTFSAPALARLLIQAHEVNHHRDVAVLLPLARAPGISREDQHELGVRFAPGDD